MEEFNRCRSYIKISLEMITRQPRLLLLPLFSSLPAGIIAWFLMELLRHPAVPSWSAAIAPVLSIGLLTLLRISFAHAVFAELQGRNWTFRGSWAFSLQRWQAALLFGVLDALASALCSVLLVYVVFIGSVAASFWWCMAGLVPCALATGLMELDRALVRAERVLSMVRFELLLASSVLNMIWNLLLQLTMSLGPTPGLATFLFILVAIPAREVLWQLFVCVVFYHTVPVSE